MKLKQSKQVLVCAVCGKGPTMAYNRPHSLHKTKKVIKPNLQKFRGVLMCTRCRRTILKKERPAA